MFDRSEKQQTPPAASTGQAQDWKVLHELSTILLQNGEIDSKLRQVLQTLSDFHGASSAVLSIHDAATGALYVRSSVGMADDALAGLNRIKPGEGACGRAFGNRKRYIAEEFEKDPCLQPYLSWANRHRIGAVYASPFFDTKNETMGALSLYFDHARRPTEREMQLADMCAGTVALFLDREEAMDTLTQSESRYRALTQTLSAIIWRCRPDGQGFEDISGWQKFTGQTAADSAGYGWVEAIHPDDRALDRPQERRAGVGPGAGQEHRGNARRDSDSGQRRQGSWQRIHDQNAAAASAVSLACRCIAVHDVPIEQSGD